MNPPLVSVVIPTFNRAYCLRRTLDSVLAQTYPAIEIVLVDDGSTDDTHALVSAHYGTDPRVRYVRQANTGVVGARNRGFKEASGEFIALLDSDDVWKPWKLQLQMACMTFAPEVGMVWTDMEAIDPGGNVVSPRFLRRMYTAYNHFKQRPLFPSSYPLEQVATIPGVPAGAFRVGDIFSQIVMGNLVHTSTVLLRRQRLDKVKGFDPNLHLAGEDYDFHLRTCREGPVGLVDVPAIQYQVGRGDQLSKHKLTIAENFLKTVTHTLETDRDRIKLPPTMIRAVLAEANAWFGGQLLENDRPRDARRYLARSVLKQPASPRVAAMLLLACLPWPLARRLRAACRVLNHRIRRPNRAPLP